MTASPLSLRVFRPRRAAPAEAVRPTRAEINLGHLRHNLRALQRAAGPAAVYGVLKADAYGHGAPAVARTLERAGIGGFAVALLEEAIELREAGIRAPLLVMGGYYGRAWGELLRHRLTPVVFDPAQLDALAAEARFAGAAPASVHLKIDTGMGRLGARPHELAALVRAFARNPEVRLEGLMTHLACADDPSNEATRAQLARFGEVEAALAAAGLRPRVRHVANSAALLAGNAPGFEWVRPGVALFGVGPAAGLGAELRPVMRVRSEIVALRRLEAGEALGYGWSWRAERPSLIATLPLGYADGLPRCLSNQGALLVRGKRAPIVGAVSMDMVMLDVTEHPGVAVGDEAVALGAQRGPLGQGEIGAAEIAAQAGTIAWEVLTGISRRVPRFFREP
ncbi:MAG TPA: alanine racemase [Polyangiaceae bacterium]|nr:alanine racemase [Polyangiaceae bacterium]